VCTASHRIIQEKKNDKGEDKTESRSRIVGHFRGQSENDLVMSKWRQVVVKSKFGSIRSIFFAVMVKRREDS
jgi:hypothetical protein